MHNPKPTEEAYEELQQAFDFFNTELFGGQLPHCLLTFQRKKNTCGYYSPKRFVRKDGTQTDEIAMNPAFFAISPLMEILQTLVHEMVHLWQSHFGKPGRRGYHNKQWAEKMKCVGLYPSSTGKPGGSETGESMADYPIEGGKFWRAYDRLIQSQERP